MLTQNGRLIYLKALMLPMFLSSQLRIFQENKMISQEGKKRRSIRMCIDIMLPFCESITFMLPIFFFLDKDNIIILMLIEAYDPQIGRLQHCKHKIVHGFYAPNIWKHEFYASFVFFLLVKDIMLILVLTLYYQLRIL